MKIAPIIRAIQNDSEGKFSYRLIHTGQHYDRNMSDRFFNNWVFRIRTSLGAGGGTPAEQTAAIIVGCEECHGAGFRFMYCGGRCHFHVGLRHHRPENEGKSGPCGSGYSFGGLDHAEEINRLATDAVTNYFFTTSQVANQHLRKSGIGEERIFFVGNTMIDTLLFHRASFHKPEIWDALRLEQGRNLVLTLHRPANVDEEGQLKALLEEIIRHSTDLPLVFPVHPRTAKILQQLQISHPRLHYIEPQGYLEFNYLVERSLAVITDSGGITEETTVMGVPSEPFATIRKGRKPSASGPMNC